MDSIRPNQPRRYRSREPLDRRFDQWIATGRQFVDGVAGNRPGKRRPFNTSRFSSSSFESVGRWVGDKLDWLLEEEDGWLETDDFWVVNEIGRDSMTFEKACQICY